MTPIERDRFDNRLERNLAARRAARAVLSANAKQGQSTYWQKAGQQCREMFGL